VKPPADISENTTPASVVIFVSSAQKRDAGTNPVRMRFVFVCGVTAAFVAMQLRLT